MKTSVIILLLIFFSACNSGLIPCPEVKTQKLKESTARQRKLKKPHYEEPAPVSASAKRHGNLPQKTEVLADKISVEEWDCPKPGSRQNRKMIKEQKKRMEKRIRLMMKKQTEMDSVKAINF